MTERLPEWDINPRTRSQEFLPISEDADDNWCAIANFLYANKNYKTLVFTDHYIRSKTDANGRVMSGKYELVEIDYRGEPATHTIVGIFLKLEMRPDFRSGREFGAQNLKVPFAHLAFAEDIEGSQELGSSADYRVLVPLTQTHELILENL